MNLQTLKTTRNKVIYIAIPKRMGDRCGEDINSHIHKINGRVYDILHGNKNINFINNSWIKENHYNEDGVHLNDAEKNIFAQKIDSILKSPSVFQ